MAIRDIDFLQKEQLTDPSQLCDNRDKKTPDFKHKQTREQIWMDGCHNTSLAKEELRMKDGELHVQIAGRKDAQEFQETQDSSLLDLIKTCSKRKDLRQGIRIHDDLLKRGLQEKNIYVGTALLRMYANCGALAEAQEVFEKLRKQDVAAWNALIAGYAQQGLGAEALRCYEQMQDEGHFPDAITFVCVLKACASIRAAEQGEEVHAEVCKQGLLEGNIVLGNALVDMYAKCGALAKAQEVFDKLPARDVITWTSLIAGYVQNGLAEEALNRFGLMQDEGLPPNAVTLVCILKACGSIEAANKGKEIHAQICKQGLLENNIVLGNALVDMYAKCGALAKAQEVFDELPARDVVSWTALIAGYANHGLGAKALTCFGQMRDERLSPNVVTFVCILKACGSIGAVKKGEDIHAELNGQRLLGKNVSLRNALVDMYAKCGMLSKAQEVFEELPTRDVASWTALISGYARHGRGDEALNCFGQMCDEGLSPDAITFVCVLQACGSIGAAEQGEEIHAEVGRQGLLEKHYALGNALLDMYAKCGTLPKAEELFQELPVRDVVSWTALMSGYAQLGEFERVFDSFNKMIERVDPDMVSFVVLLTACSHAGLVEEGQMYFDTMTAVHCIVPTLEHHTCMVDLFSRAGHFDKAISVIKKVPPSESLLVWLAFLGACRKWVNVELGKWAFEHVVQLDAKHTPAYVCMTNIYAAAGMLEDADEVEALRKKNEAWIIPERCWWTDVSSNVHSFIAGDRSHPQSKCIYAKLNDISQKLALEGYSPRLHWASRRVSNDEVEDMLCGHSEKLAIACALINTCEGAPIRITKNVGVCADCHLATSLISKIEKRKIQVNDAERIHIFECGKCICEEYC